MGTYNFAHGRDYVTYAKKMIELNLRVNMNFTSRPDLAVGKYGWCNAPVNPEQNIIQNPSGNYPLINFYIAIPSFDYRTGVIISSATQNPNPIFSIRNC